jgi:hypothetical protein
VTLAAVIPVWNAYARYWPRAWSEVTMQIKAGAPVSEVVVARPSGSEPSLALLGEALEKAAGREVPRLHECPVPDPTPTVGMVRNAALDHVSSRLVAFVDVDDRIAPGIWRDLSSLHDRYPYLGSAAAASLKRLPDGTIAALRGRAHRIRRPHRMSPDRAWHQALLWRLSIEAAVLAPAAGAVHRTQALRDCGGYGRSAMEDMVLGAASVSCAPACYMPRLVGRLWEARPDSLWSRPHPRDEVLKAHDEMVARLGGLAAQGRLRPGLARRWRLAVLLLALRRRRLERMTPPEGLRADGDPLPSASRIRVSEELRSWLKGAARAERRMAERLGSSA